MQTLLIAPSKSQHGVSSGTQPNKLLSWILKRITLADDLSPLSDQKREALKAKKKKTQGTVLLTTAEEDEAAMMSLSPPSRIEIHFFVLLFELFPLLSSSLFPRSDSHCMELCMRTPLCACHQLLIPPEHHRGK